MRVYIASSWQNEEAVLSLAAFLRKCGHEVYCFAERSQRQHIFMWPDVVDPERDDGISALLSEDSKKAFAVDLNGLHWANCCVLLLPSGRDSHLEAGYVKGRGGLLYIVGQFPKGEYSNMYHLADGLFRLDDLDKLIKELV